MAQLGWYSNSTSCPIGEHTWTSVLASAGVAIHAAELLTEVRAVYALCRPPGHHAYPDMMSGICYLNNAAIAAERLAGRFGKVAILDIDVHHGNGTQAIFWKRADVFYASIHGDPAVTPPYYAGYADEIGEGAGKGVNLNLPLPPGAGDPPFLGRLDQALKTIAVFQPGALVVSLGFDASEHEAVPTLRVSVPGFGEAARRIAGLRLPTALIQEGGYLNPRLGDNLATFLDTFGASR